MISLQDLIIAGHGLASFSLAASLIALWYQRYGRELVYWGIATFFSGVRAVLFLPDYDHLGADRAILNIMADQTLLVVMLAWLYGCHIYIPRRFSVWWFLPWGAVSLINFGRVFFPIPEAWYAAPYSALISVMQVYAVFLFASGRLRGNFLGRVAIVSITFFSTNEIYYRYFIDVPHFIIVMFSLTTISLLASAIASPFIYLQDALAALRRAMAQLETASRAKTHFLANMSHELRTPLNAVLGFSEIMNKELFGKIGSPKYREYAEVIQESGQHLLMLINDILDVAKIEEGKMTLHEEPTQLRDILAKVLRILRPRVEAKGLVIEQDIAADIPRLMIDPRLMQQALLNLVGNAVKFTPDSHGKIKINARRAANGLVIEVVDNGPGIKPEDIPDALTPFSQVDSQIARAHEGTGLGLPLAKSMIDCTQ